MDAGSQGINFAGLLSMFDPLMLATRMESLGPHSKMLAQLSPEAPQMRTETHEGTSCASSVKTIEFQSSLGWK
jgi:hypothetical protein